MWTWTTIQKMSPFSSPSDDGKSVSTPSDDGVDKHDIVDVEEVPEEYLNMTIG